MASEANSAEVSMVLWSSAEDVGANKAEGRPCNNDSNYILKKSMPRTSMVCVGLPPSLAE